jgi:hypothetical protein
MKNPWHDKISVGDIILTRQKIVIDSKMKLDRLLPAEKYLVIESITQNSSPSITHIDSITPQVDEPKIIKKRKVKENE